MSITQKIDRPSSPPFYTPFYFLSSVIVQNFQLKGITPNIITIGWVVLMTSAGYVLTINQPRLVLPLVLFSILLDCLDGDLARARLRASSSGSLLERTSHWWSNMALIAGAGIGICIKLGDVTGIFLLAFLCVSQAIYLGVITDVQRLVLPTGPPTRSMRVLFLAIKINYYLNPVELPLAVLLFLFGLNFSVLWGFGFLLLLGAASVFLPQFIVLLSIDKIEAQSNQAGEFPEDAIEEAKRIINSRPEIDWYAIEPSKIPPEVLRIFGSQPIPSNDPYIVNIERQLEKDLQTLFRTSGEIFTLPYGPVSAIEAVLRHMIKPGDSAIVIVGGPTGRTWSKAIRLCGGIVVEINVPYGNDIDLTSLEETIARAKDAKVLFAALAEPTVGTLYDISAIGQYLRGGNHKIKFVVDVTTGLAVDDFRMDEWGIDLAVGGCGGGLMSPVQASIVAISNETLQTFDTRVFVKAPGSILNSLADTELLPPEDNNPLSSYVFEPLYVALRMILTSGLDTVLVHRQEVAKAFRRGCVDILHLDLVPRNPTAACTNAFLPSNIQSNRLVQLLSEKYHIGVHINVLSNGRETMSIGHSGWIFREDIYRIIEALALVLAELSESGE